MKRNIFIILAFLPLFSWGQTLTFEWVSGFTVDGSDTTLTNDVTGLASTYYLRNIDFDLSYLTDSNFIPLNTNTSIELSNGDSLPLITFGIYKRNYGYDSASFFQILETEATTDSLLIHPMRITGVEEWDSKNDRDAAFNVIPYSSTWFDVPNEYGGILAAHNAASPGDTIIWRTGTQGFYIFTKSHSLVGAGDCSFSGGGSITTTSGLTYIQSGVYAERTGAANLYTFQGTGNNINIDNVYFDAPQCLLANNGNYNNCYFNGRLDLSVSPTLSDCYFSSTYIVWLRANLDVNFTRCKMTGTTTTRPIALISSPVSARFKACNIFNGFLTSSGGVSDYSLDNCTYQGVSSTFRFASINGEDVTITNSDLSTGELFTQDCETSISNTSIHNMYLFQNSVLSSIANFTLDNVAYTNDLFSNITIFNAVPTITNSSFICSGKFGVSMTNTVINPNEINILNNSFQWSYSDAPENLLFIDTDSSTAFNQANIVGNEFKLSHYYSNDTAHHTYLNFNTPSYFAYNEVHGAIIGNVVKNTDYVTTNVENIVFNNKFLECETPIFWRSSRKSIAYHNTFFNDTIAATNFFSIDDNITGRNSDSCIVRNNLIQSSTGNYLNFGASGDSVGVIATNNIVYNTLPVRVGANTTSFATWQSLGYDLSSFNTDPLLDINLCPDSNSDAASSGYNLGSPYNLGLVCGTLFPDPSTRSQTIPFPTIGATAIDKPLDTKLYYEDGGIKYGGYLEKDGTVYQWVY